MELNMDIELNHYLECLGFQTLRMKAIETLYTHPQLHIQQHDQVESLAQTVQNSLKKL